MFICEFILLEQSSSDQFVSFNVNAILKSASSRTVCPGQSLPFVTNACVFMKPTSVEQFVESRITSSIYCYLRSLHRSFFTTEKGYVGLGPPNTMIRDKVFVLLGCNVPVILRKAGEHWFFAGEAFVTAIMDGEIVQQSARGTSNNTGHATQAGRFSEEIILLC